MSRLTLKRGDTFAASVTDSNGIAGITVEAAIRQGAFYELLTVDIVDADAGIYSLSAPASVTGNWPLGLLTCDLKYSIGDTVGRSQNFEIYVFERITE